MNRLEKPLLAANCQWDDAIKPKNVAPYRIFKLKGVTVGVIGTAPPFVGEERGPLVEILPVAESVKPIVGELAGKVDILVLLTHVGVPADKELIKAFPEVDIVFGGHHHKRFAALTFDQKTQTVLQHSGMNGECVGKVTITWDGKRIVERKAELVNITADLLEAEEVKAVAVRYRSKK